MDCQKYQLASFSYCQTRFASLAVEKVGKQVPRGEKIVNKSKKKISPKYLHFALRSAWQHRHLVLTNCFCNSPACCRWEACDTGCRRSSSPRTSWTEARREKRRAFRARIPGKADLCQLSNYFLVNAATYAVESTDALSPVDLHQAVAHAAVVFVALPVDDVVILKTKPRLHHPDGICHQKSEDSGLAGGEHVERWSQSLRRVAALNPPLDCVVAAKRRLVSRASRKFHQLTTRSRIPKRCPSPRRSAWLLCTGLGRPPGGKSSEKRCPSRDIAERPFCRHSLRTRVTKQFNYACWV